MPRTTKRTGEGKRKLLKKKGLTKVPAGKEVHHKKPFNFFLTLYTNFIQNYCTTSNIEAGSKSIISAIYSFQVEMWKVPPPPPDPYVLGAIG